MTNTISFIVYGRPEPQGSSRAFVIAGRAHITSANKKLKPYRQEVAGAAIVARDAAGVCGVFAPKHVPVFAEFRFYFERPPSIPKRRVQHVVKPDIDKLVRASLDAITGILLCDDAQVVELIAKKFYGSPARVEITVRIAQDNELPTANKETPCQTLLLASE